MRLSQLIKEALSEIALGVKSAKDESSDLLAIAPGFMADRIVAEITYIDFDVSIAISDKSDNKSSTDENVNGEIRVLTLAALGGKSISSTSTNKSISHELSHRISFRVPVCMAGNRTGS